MLQRRQKFERDFDTSVTVTTVSLIWMAPYSPQMVASIVRQSRTGATHVLA